MRPPAPSTRPAAGLAIAALAAPAVLAFFDGGYFDAARDAALIGAGVLLALAALLAPRPLPRARPARVALAGLTALTAWTALSTRWAPLHDAAWATAERDLLYLAALVALVALLRGPAARAAEPLLALGALVAVGYGLLGRLVPDLVHAVPSVSAGGRLDQPLTYWNAMGALAAIGVVLAARMAGDPTRTAALRCAAAAAAVPLCVGMYLTFSRGALAACAAGLVVLLALAPTWTQLRAVAVVLASGGLGCVAAAASPAVRTLSGSHRAAQGALVLVALAGLMAATAGLQRWVSAAEAGPRSRLGRLPLPRGHGWIAAALVAAMLIVPVGLAAGQGAPSSADPRFGTSTSRLASTDSPRYEYWNVALRTFADHPLAGTGAGGFAVAWLRERPQAQPARDAHSLPIETAAELGLVGVAALALLAGGIAVAARRGWRARPALATGPAAALVVYAFHASIDWDWEMPALTLVAVGLAAVLLAAADDAR